MIAQFSIYSLDSRQLAENTSQMVEVLKNSSLPYQVGPIGICVEGDWDRVMAAIQQCRDVMIAEHERLVTTITVLDVKSSKRRLADLVKNAELHGSRMPHGDMETEC